MSLPISRRRLIQLSTTPLVAGGVASLGGCSDGSDSRASLNKLALPQDPRGRWWLRGNYARCLKSGTRSGSR